MRVKDGQERGARASRRRLQRLVVFLVLAAVLAVGSVGVAVWTYQNRSVEGTRDAALVLGAAAYALDRPSNVYRERIRHGVALFHSGRVKKLVFSGGSDPSEGEVGRWMALRAGVPDSAIVIEGQASSTLENFLFSCPLLREEGIEDFFVVSDPMHEFRAVTIARLLGLDGDPSPTTTSAYRSLKTRSEFWVRETLHVFDMFVRPSRSPLVRRKECGGI